MRIASCFVLSLAGLLLVGSIAGATPSSIILIPSTDVVDEGVVHMDLDTLFTVSQGGGNASALSIGATYGVFEDVEVGFDWLSDTTNPLVGNIKWQPYSNDEIAIAIGAWLCGDNTSSGANQFYGLVSYDSDIGRFAAGGAFGSKTNLGMDENQLWLSYDKALDDEWWVGADYVSGDSWLGSLNVGVGYAVADNAGLILGYNSYNAGGPGTLTMQVDANFN